MATSAGSPQIAIRAPGSNKCPIHHRKEVVLYCINCEKLVCTDCVIQECVGHVFDGISNLVPTAKEKLQTFITKVELTELPRMKEQLQDTESDLTKNRNHFKNQISEIRKQNEMLKKELDKITETLVKTCQDMEQQNTDELLIYKKEVQTRIDKLSSQIQEFKGTLQSGSDILVFDNSQKVPPKIDNLSKQVCSAPEFIPAKFSLSKLEQLFGKLNNTIKNKPNLSGNWRVASELTPYTGHFVKSIHITSGGQTWLSFYNPNTKKTVEKMLLTDQTGQTIQTMDMDVRVFDFCLSPNTGNIWYCSQQDNSVREVKGGTSTIRFKTDTQPWSICITKDDHVIIGQDRQVVKYTLGGQVVCRSPGRNIPVVRTPYHLSECPVTSQIAVADNDRKEHGGNGRGFVSIWNNQLQLLYTYTGEVQGQQSPPKPLDPCDVCYTRTGELLITDWNNKSVVAVTGTGRYLQTLYTHSESRPRAACVHNDAVWVSFENRTVQMLQNN